MGEETRSSNLLNSDRESIDDVNREVEPQLQAAVAPFHIPVPTVTAGPGPVAGAPTPLAIEPTYDAAEMVEPIEEQGYNEGCSQLVLDSMNPIPSIPAQSYLVVIPIFTMPHSEADELAREATTSRAHYCNSIT